MRATRLALTLALTLGIFTPARAATYSTPALQAPDNGSLVCIASNVGTTPVNVTMTIYTSLGAAVTPGTDICANDFGGVLPPGATCFQIYSAVVPFGRCTVDASSSKIRAVLLTRDPVGNVIATQAATKK